MTPRRLAATTLATLGAVLAIAGCASDDAAAAKGKKPTTRTADAALADPFGKWSNVDTDISGGDTAKFKKDALQRDMDHFLLK